MNNKKLQMVEKNSVKISKKKKHRSRSKKSSDSDVESDSFDYNLKVEFELKDKPEVLEFILKLKEYIRKQEKKIKKLKSSLKRWVFIKHNIVVCTNFRGYYVYIRSRSVPS